MPGRVQVPPGFVLFARGAVASTQDEVRALAAGGAGDGTVVWAETQNAGRGRRSRQWDSPPGNLYVSLLVQADTDLADAAQLSFVTALAVRDALALHVGEPGRLTLKWPNDVLLDGAKVAGILLETEPGAKGGLPLVVIGVGVNLASHPPETPYPATDLASAEGRHLTPARLLGDYLAAFADWRRIWRSKGFAPVRAAWLEHAAGLGGQISVRLPDGTQEGRFVTLDERGALVLETDTGARHSVTAGDVFVG